MYQVSKISLLLLLISLPCFLLAQEPLFNIQFFNQEDGLIAREVKAITQDDRGMIWLGTGNGLCRYDGYEFKVVKGKNNPLASELIYLIVKDNEGDFWLQKPNEMVIHFDPENEEIIPLSKEEQSYGKLQLRRSNEFFSSTVLMNEKGESFYLTEQNKIKPLLPPQYGVFFETENKTFVCQIHESGEIVEVNRKGDILRELDGRKSLGPHSKIISSDNPNVSLIADADSIKNKLLEELFFVKNDNGIEPLNLTIDGKSVLLGDFIHEKITAYYIHLSRDRQGRTWLCANNQLLIFGADGELIKNLTETLFQQTEEHFTFNGLFIDESDLCWVMTGVGVVLINATDNPFQNYLSDNGGESVRGISDLGNDQLLVGSYQGTKILDKTTGKVLKQFNSALLGISELKEDTIWGGLHDQTAMGLFLNSEQELLNAEFGFWASTVNLPVYDSVSNRVYLGTGNGLAYLDENRQRKKYAKLNNFEELQYLNIKHIVFEDDIIWLATNKGIYKLKRGEGVVEHVEFMHYAINYIYIGQEDKLWLATSGGGLIKWERNTGKVTQITTENGLSHNVIYSIHKDANDFFWLPSDNGLMRFNPANGDVVVFQPKDGISDKEFNTYSHFQAPDGRLYLGGIKGVNAFYPEEVAPVENNAPFIITQYEQFDGAVDSLLDKTNELLKQQEIILKPGDSFFTIGFALLDYTDSDNIYAWRIEGLDEAWTHQTDNSIRINTLNYGSYTLHIKAKGAGGQWANHKIKIPIEVLKPFYLKSGFILAVLAGMILLTWYYFNQRTVRLEKRAERLERDILKRTQTIREQNEQLQDASRFKDKILTLVAHDLRAPLITLNGLAKKINYLLRKDRIEDVGKLSNTIDNSTANVTILLDNIMNWALVQRGRFRLYPQKIKVNYLIDEVIQLYQDTANAKAIRLIQPEKEGVVYADEDSIRTVLRNILNNAIKFTPEKGTITFKVFQKVNQTCIEVSDTGIGIPAESLKTLFEFDRDKRVKGTKGEKGTGFGLMLCEELMRLNKGYVTVESKVNKGTKVSIFFPVG